MSAILSTAKFLDVVVPAGNRYIGYTDGTKSSSGREIIKCSAFTEALQGVTRARNISNRETDPNIYFALASFKEAKVYDEKGRYMKSYRQIQNVDKVKSLWLDIDFKMYDNPQACVQDIQRFLSDFPDPTFMVNSGGGIHLYWVFEDALTLQQWEPLATGLAAIAKAKKLRADYGVTIDAARVLRLPGYVNPKYPHKPQCEIKKMGNYASLARMDELLRPHAAAVRSTGIAVDSNVIAMFDPVTQNNDLSEGYTPTRRSFFAAIATGCGVVKDSLDRHGNGDSYQLWKDLLHLAAFTEDGDTYAQEISNGDPRYDPANVEDYYDQSVKLRQAGTRGPTTCERFSTSSEKCAVCPHAGKIKTPWMLGVPIEDKMTQAPSFVRNGKTYTTTIVEEDGEQVIQEVMLVDAELDNWHLVPSMSKEAPIELWLDVRNGRSSRVVKLNGPIIADSKRFKTAFFNGGLGLDTSQAGKVTKVAMNWQTHLSKLKEGTTLVSTGWNDKADAFVMGESVYTANGVEMISNPILASAGEIGTKGKIGPWLELAQTILDDDEPAFTYLFCAGMAAPLMGILSNKCSLAISAFSQDSGAGKTTVLRTVRSAFGAPRSGNSLSDTETSIVIKMGAEQGLPAIYDEIRDKGDDGESIVNILFQMTQGSTKGRATQQATLQQRQILNTMMLCGSNIPIGEYVSRRIRYSNAGFARFIEIELEAKAKANLAIDNMVSKLEDNYGHFGPIYIRKLLELMPHLKNYESKVQHKLESRREWRPEERFWLWGSTKIMLAAAMVNATGLLRVDPVKLFEYVIAAVENQKSEMSDKVDSEDDILAKLTDMYSDEMLITDRFKGRGPGTVVVERPPLRNKVKLHVSVEERAMRIPVSVIEDFAAKYGDSARGIRRKMKDRFHARELRKVMGAGCSQFSSVAAVSLIELDLNQLTDGAELISSWLKATDKSSTTSPPATPDSSSDGQP